MEVVLLGSKGREGEGGFLLIQLLLLLLVLHLLTKPLTSHDDISSQGLQPYIYMALDSHFLSTRTYDG